MPDIKYTRDGRVRQYLSIHKHQKNARNNFSKWVNVNIEKETFDNADYGGLERNEDTSEWMDNEGNLYGFIVDFQKVGTRKEQFGFFPKTTNPPHEEWHGYPFLPFSGNNEYGENYGRDIPEDLITQWIEQELLSPNKIDRLLNGKII